MELLFSFLIAFVASLLLTPQVKRIATKFGFVDKPDGKRKAHKKPVALGGGAGVFLAALLAIAITIVYASLKGENLIRPDDTKVMVGLLLASAFIVLLGLLDDFIHLAGRYKLIGQIIAAGLLIYFGVRIESVSIFAGRPAPKVEQQALAVEPGLESGAAGVGEADAGQSPESSVTPDTQHSQQKSRGIKLGLLAVPFTLFWLLGAINAINLIDGIDGLASSVGLVLCATIAAITLWQGYVFETLVMLSLAGALLGFLRFNFAPASIYLGDAGSMLIGLLIGGIAIHSSLKSAATVALAVPMGVWAIPILDSMAAILRRKLTGRSFFAPDRGHLHHSLLVRGWTVRQAVLFIGLICATTCLSAVISVYFGNELIALLTVAAVVIFLIATQTFGHIEFALVKERLRSHGLSLSSGTNWGQSRPHESHIHLQGAREWDKLWMAIIEPMQDYQVIRLKLVIRIPALHEDYFASWDATREHKERAERSWQMEYPITVRDEVVGHMEIEGIASKDTTLPQMQQVLNFLEPLEEDVQHIMEEIQGKQSTLNLKNSLQKPTNSEESSSAQTVTPQG
jgi:UDP-GlcNAc:undecaprenyl-phosphate GlcNAc-1-phosphate transferase